MGNVIRLGWKMPYGLTGDPDGNATPFSPPPLVAVGDKESRRPGLDRAFPLAASVLYYAPRGTGPASLAKGI